MANGERYTTSQSHTRRYQARAFLIRPSPTLTLNTDLNTDSITSRTTPLAADHTMQAENITYLSNKELDRRHHDATQAWSIKLARVLMYDWMRAIMPTLYDIYQTPDSFEVTFVPDDVQLPLLFMQYNSIAMMNFTARPSFNLRDHTMNRVIWYWNLDPTHSFSRHFRMVRYNLILMAFAWASGFKKEYFPKPGVEKFVKLFIQAWIESLVDHREWSEGAFQAREVFLDYWQGCRLDLINFRSVDVEKMKKITKELKTMPIEDSLTESPKTFIEDCRSGRISDEQFEKYGPMLAIRWLHEYQQDAEYEQAHIDATFEAEAEAEAEAEQEYNEDQAMFEEEMEVFDESNNEMDITDENCGFHIVGDSAGGHPFSTADWNCEVRT